jgi:hypothetical protein
VGAGEKKRKQNRKKLLNLQFKKKRLQRIFFKHEGRGQGRWMEQHYHLAASETGSHRHRKQLHRSAAFTCRPLEREAGNAKLDEGEDHSMH